MKAKLDISYELFSQHFEINSSVPSGLVWKKVNKHAQSISIGSQAGCLLQSGYYQVKFHKKKYYVHRIIYSLHTKIDLPNHLSIDHIDRNKANNSPTNLKLVTHTENMWNSTKPRTNTSGYVNISNTKYGWCVRINHNKSRIEKTCDTFDEALEFRNNTVFSLRGMFPID